MHLIDTLNPWAERPRTWRRASSGSWTGRVSITSGWAASTPIAGRAGSRSATVGYRASRGLGASPRRASPNAAGLDLYRNPACVRVDHLRLEGAPEAADRPKRARKGTGSMRVVRPGTWELRVTIGRWDNGRPRSFTRTVSAKSEATASALLADFVDEMTVAAPGDPGRTGHHGRRGDGSVSRRVPGNGERPSREDHYDYRYLHQRWFSPQSATSRSNGSKAPPWTNCSASCAKPA